MSWKRLEVIGDCVLYEGDCLEVMPMLGPVDAVVTDAPFGISDAAIKGQVRTGKRTGAVAEWWKPSEIVWAKDCHVGPPSPVAARDERIWVFSENGVKGATFETSVWDHPIIPTWSHKHHKNEKPVGLMQRLIRWVGAETVLDPFMGSGTTLVACAKLGRTGIGIELDPDYFDIACKRVEEAYRQPDMFVERPPAPKQEGFDL